MRGVVVCPQPRAAEIGAEVLEAGGNAFDAAIAAALGQMVTDAQMCGLGGMGCATYATADGDCGHYGFHARTGSKATPDMWAKDYRGKSDLGGYTMFDDHRSNLGHTAVGTPGTVAGLAALHRHARLPWADLLRPAAELARTGFPAPDSMFQMLARTSGPGMPTPMQRITHTPDSKKLWCREDGTMKQPGDLWINPDMADTLDRLARHGADEFYKGELARQIAAELERGGGHVTLADLNNYRVRVAEPLSGTFRGLKVRTSTPPGGGITVLQVLNILNRFAPATPYTPEAAVMFAAAMQAAFVARASSVADPEFFPVPIDELLSAKWADEAAAAIRNRVQQPATAGAGSAGTTHLSVYDADGNAVALTHTLGSFSGVIVPGTGIPLNSALDHADPIPGNPNSIAPGKARVSAMAPTIVFGDNGRPRYITGSPGTNAIVTCIVQALVGVVDFGMGPHEAVAMPRVHCEGGPVFVEGRISQRAQAALTERGFEVRPFTGNYVPSCGRNQFIAIEPDGAFKGASDPRRDGGVAAYATA